MENKETRSMMPSVNYEKAICITCGDDFTKRKVGRSKTLASGTLGSKAINCGPRCAKIWRQLPDYKRKEMRKRYKEVSKNK